MGITIEINKAINTNKEFLTKNKAKEKIKNKNNHQNKTSTKPINNQL